MISELGYKLYLTTITLWSWWWQAENKPDELARTILTVSVPPLVLLWFKYTSSFSKKGTSALPPGPYGLPILGYLPFLTPNLHSFFADMAHTYGPIFSLQLGSKLHVVLNSMDLIKTVTRDMDQTFANRNPPVTALTITYGGNDIAFAKNATHWRYMRKLIATQVFNKTSLNNSQSFRTHEVRKMVSHVYSKTGTKVNLNEVAFVTEINVVTSLLWGGSKTGDKKDSGHINDGFREVQANIAVLLAAPNISDFLPVLKWFDLQGRKRDMQKQLDFVDEIFENIIQERIKVNSRKAKGAVEEDGKKDLLQTLLELRDQEDDPSSFNIVQIKALLMDIIVAGTHPTSTMVEWAMAELLKNPRVLRKVQDELDKVVGMDNIVEESYIPKLPYLDAVIKETFRLHAPVPLLIHRSPDESAVVGGYTIPKGATVYMNVWAAHRDPKNWPNPLEFKPERFLDDKWDYTGNNSKFLPFGSGRRICPGIPLGDKMLMYILASLLHSFDWSLPDNEVLEMADEFGFVTKKKNPLIATPSARLSNAMLYK